MLANVFVFLQYLLPRHWLTAVIYRVARISQPRIKDFLITRFAKLYAVDLDEVRLEVPAAFATFNEFFVRELEDGARPVNAEPGAIVSPVDGTVSFAGHIAHDALYQAKGIDYSLGDLLATDTERANAFVDGRFATIYLAPYNYHRVHAPLAGTLRSLLYVPGDLFSVNEATVSRVRGLFRRNERLVLHFDTAIGPAALIFVGALNVGSITTPWTGEIRPRKDGVAEVLEVGEHPAAVAKGDLLGWFNMGSTVVLLLPPGKADWDPRLDPGRRLRMGERIGTLHGNPR